MQIQCSYWAVLTQRVGTPDIDCVLIQDTADANCVLIQCTADTDYVLKQGIVDVECVHSYNTVDVQQYVLVQITLSFTAQRCACRADC